MMGRSPLRISLACDTCTRTGTPLPAGMNQANQGAAAALEQARNFDKAGQEAQCMNAVQQAKKLAGS